MSDAQAGLDDEAFLDDVFDAVSSKLAAGEAPDRQRWTRERPHLEEQIEATLQLAAEVWGASPAAATPSIPGYEIVRELGRGGMGSVFLARQKALAGRLVALKVLPRGSALSQQARARFHGEIQALARIRHANVIDIYDVIELDATPAYAMEWVDGHSLLELIEHRVASGQRDEPHAFDACLGGNLPNEGAATTIARWGCQVADALVAAHGEGLLHRDLKPSNIMVRRDGEALLTDFGVVRDEGSTLATRTGAFLGTPAYAAPEQLRGAEVDERTDVYGLGATLYHALTGAPPFADPRQDQVLRAVEMGSLRPLRKLRPEVGRDLATIVETAMEVSPQRRYLSAAELRDDLQRYLDGQPVAARPASVVVRFGKYARRNRSSLRGAVIGSLLAIGAAVSIAAYFVRQARIPAEFAEHVRQARLIVLDPAFDERVAVVMHRAQAGREPWVAEWSGEDAHDDLGTAIAEFDAALALIENESVRAEREVLVMARFLAAAGEGGRPMPLGLRRSAPATFAFARRWHDIGAAPDASSIPLASMQPLERRCLGLLALVLRQDSLCLMAWRGLDLAEVPDPLVDAALGQLYRQRKDPSLAWPRLERAFVHFHEARFLGVGVAEVACACGDADYALRMLDRVGEAGDIGYDISTRIRADVLAQLGQREAARALYERHAARGNLPPASHDSLARFFLAEGEFERALRHRWRMALRWPTLADHAQELSAVLDAWWVSLTAVQRSDRLRQSLRAPGTFLDQVAYARARGAKPIAAVGDALQLDSVRLAALRQQPLVHEQVVDAVLRGERFDVPLPQAPRVLRRPSPAWRYEWISVGVDGGPANASSRSPCISGNGRLVAFASAADNLVAGDGNEVVDVFVRDRKLGSTRRLSFAGGGATILPSLSADGRWLACYGRCNDRWFCHVFDLATGICERVGTGLATVPKEPPALDASGQRVLFVEGASTMASRATLWDRSERCEVWTSALSSQGWVGFRRALSPDGDRVVLTDTTATVIEPDANAWLADVFVHGVTSGEVSRISTAAGRQADTECKLVAMSASHDAALFWSRASSLATIDNFTCRNLFLRDNTNGTVVRVNEFAGRGFAVSDRATRCGEGTVMVAWGPGAEEAQSRRLQLWLRDDATGDLQLLTCMADGTPANGSSGEPCASVRGDVVAFTTKATNLVTGFGASAAAQVVVVLR